jgi:hypothetical protein
VSEQKRLVTVTAVVMTEETEGPEDITASYAAVAMAMTDLVERRLNGDMSALAAIAYPLLRFEARSEPVPDGEAAGLSVTDLREMLDEATRAMHDLAGAADEMRHARDIRSRAGLGQL